MHKAWLGEFGDAYNERCAPNGQDLRNRTRMWADIFKHMEAAPPRNILEVGCNVGQNLACIGDINGEVLTGVEPNEAARTVADSLSYASAVDGEAIALPFGDGVFDLSFTAGVLIHVPPEEIEGAINELWRVSSRYIVMVEYFAAEERMIPYRGENDMLWLRDYGGLLLDLHPTARCRGYGFHWQPMTGIDNTTYWVFEK